MVAFDMMTPHEMQKAIADQVRILRLELNFSQQTLAKKSGVSYGTLKKFEQTGKISLESLLKLAVVFGCMHDFKTLFASTPIAASSLDDLIKNDIRKRGRK